MDTSNGGARSESRWRELRRLAKFARPGRWQALGEAREVYRQAYNEVLLRPPRLREVFGELSRGERARLSGEPAGPAGLDGALVRERLRGSDEAREVARPLEAQIERVFERYVMRAPRREELAVCAARVRARYPEDHVLREALASGAARTALGVRPLKVELDVTSRCNLRCVMCTLSDARFSRVPKAELTLEEFRRIASELFWLCHTVSLSFGAEPFVHPRFLDIMREAARHEVPWLHINTNGQLLDAEKAAALVDVGFHHVAVSIDAAKASTYERIRVGGDFEQLLENLRGLQRIKRQRRAVFPYLTLNFVLMRSNLDELPAFVELAHSLGARGIAAQHVTPYDGLDTEGETLDREPERANAVMQEARRIGERLGVPLALPEPFTIAEAPRAVAPQPARDMQPASSEPVEQPAAVELKAQTPPGFRLSREPIHGGSSCRFPWNFVGLDSRGRVLPCGWWFTEEPMGNLLEEDFESIWNGARYSALRESHRAGTLGRSCADCPAAGMGSVDHPGAFRTARPSPFEGAPRSAPSPS